MRSVSMMADLINDVRIGIFIRHGVWGGSNGGGISQFPAAEFNSDNIFLILITKIKLSDHTLSLKSKLVIESEFVVHSFLINLSFVFEILKSLPRFFFSKTVCLAYGYISSVR